MTERRDFWKRHVRVWRRSGMTMRAYCERHAIARGTLGYWSWKLNNEGGGTGSLVEVGPLKGSAEARAHSVERPVEVLVGGRYVLRVWAGTTEEHLAGVLEALEGRR
jgi:hypothetical protein